MATLRAQAILEQAVNVLKAWTLSPAFQAVVNGVKGSAEAEDIFARVEAITWASTDSHFLELRQLLGALNKKRKIFKSDLKLRSFEILLTCAALSAKHLTDMSVSANDDINTLNTFGFDSPFLTADIFIHRPTDPVAGLIYIDFDKCDLNRFENVLASGGTATPFQLANAFSIAIQKPSNVMAFTDSSIHVSDARIVAFARAASVSAGKPFHNPTTYTGSALVRTLFHPLPTTTLEQFSDIHQVLSECFSETDVLNRFLRLYQVLENFMVRRQIITVQNTAGAELFSIRDFRRLYSQVEKNESASLTELCASAMDITTHISAGKTLPEIIADRWDAQVHGSGSQPQIAQGLLQVFGSSPTNGPIFDTAAASVSFRNRTERSKLFSRLAYAFRNMIVHNKETEFHLTHLSMPIGVALFMNNFLLPCIDDMIFALLEIDRTVIWYQQSALQLYKT